MQSFVLQLFHHLVEYIDNTICLLLSHTAQTGTEILFLQQLHTVPNEMKRLDDTAIEHRQIENRQKYESFHQEEQGNRFRIESMIGNDCQYRQQQCSQYPKQSFYSHQPGRFTCLQVYHISLDDDTELPD